jgi:hypothetical protein
MTKYDSPLIFSLPEFAPSHEINWNVVVNDTAHRDMIRLSDAIHNMREEWTSYFLVSVPGLSVPYIYLNMTESTSSKGMGQKD